MPRVRKIYRGCKVWVDVDDAGAPVLERGLATIRYREDATQSYSVRPAELGPLAEEGSAAPAPRPARSAPRRAPRKPRARAAPGAAEEILIHTDGSCFGNPGPAGIGVLLEWKGRTREISRFIGDGTNNIAELTAIQVALTEVKNRRLPVRLYTDSAYAIGVLSEGWRAKENRELIAAIQARMREFADLELRKVRGHDGDPRNERVDQLARDAISRRA